MKRFEFELENEHGLHARPAGLMVETCNAFACDIHFYKGTQKVNGKSMLGILMLAASKGNALAVEADGADEIQAIEAIKNLIDSQFDE